MVKHIVFSLLIGLFASSALANEYYFPIGRSLPNSVTIKPDNGTGIKIEGLVDKLRDHLKADPASPVTTEVRASQLSVAASLDLGFNYFGGNYGQNEVLVVLDAMRYQLGPAVPVAASGNTYLVQVLYGVHVRTEFSAQAVGGGVSVSVGPTALKADYKREQDRLLFEVTGFTKYHPLHVDTDSSGLISFANLRKNVTDCFNDYCSDDPATYTPTVIGLLVTG